MYLMDPGLAQWGMFLTFNSASVQQYLAAGYDMTTIAYYFPHLLVNDSAYDFDPNCYQPPFLDCGMLDGTATYDDEGNCTSCACDMNTGEGTCCDNPIYTGEACGGRLVMNFPPTCVPEVEAHQIVAEFVSLASLGCEGTGDVAGGFDDLPCSPSLTDPDCVCNYDAFEDCEDDGGTTPECADEWFCYDELWNEEFEGPDGNGVVNVIDIVKIVGHILGTSPLGGWLLCEADLNGDDQINVVDVVAVVNIVLGNTAMGSNDATEATIVDNGTSVSIMSDGYVGGIDMIVEFNGQFDIALDSKFIGDMTISENTAHILLVGLNKDNLNRENIEGAIFDYTGDILSISQEVANSREMIDNVTFSDGMPSGYEISTAYPNPFNPSTSFEMRLYEASNLTVKVYNLTGQLVDVIAEGNFTADTHTFTWNAENLASGVYFISTQIGSNVENQKVMLIK